MTTDNEATNDEAEGTGADVAALAAAERDYQEIRIGIHNLANIFLHTGNHEVRTAIKEIARIFCIIIGEEHAVFFPDSPPIRDTNPNVGTTLTAPAGGYGWPGQGLNTTPPQPRSGIAVPGLPPSPFAPPVAHNPQSGGGGAFPTSGGDPANPTGARMVVVDPGPYGGGPGPDDLARMQAAGAAPLVPAPQTAAPAAQGAPLVPGSPFRPRHGG